jgi:hypothetical protein
VITWLTAFIDLAPGVEATTVEFWRAVTGSTLSARRGEHDEFATLVPRLGDAHLRVQRLAAGESRIHLDVHDPSHEFAVHTSPGGLTWCAVSHPESVRSSPVVWPGGHASLVDQVCLDIPSAIYDDECRFWSELTGWPIRESRSAEFRFLDRPTDQPLRILLQRLDDEDGPVRAHLDIATTDRAAETARHVALGADVRAERPRWTVMTDPAGLAYCITDRDPSTGVLRTSP